jgi:uncharacterized integral membrane protein (TIGR00698 family)
MPESAVQRPSLLSSEDWISCWLGFALILLALIGLQPALPGFSWDGASLGAVFASENLLASCALGALFMVLAIAGMRLMGGNLKAFAIGFPAVFLLGWLSQFVAGNAVMKAWGLTYVISALLIGLFISNVLTLPRWMREAVRTEYYIKTGLVILGSNILIGEILQAGMLGVGQAFLVILVIWYVCFWIAQKMRVDDEFSAMLATAVSICGVSAAIAACGAVQGDRKKLSYVTSLVLIVAIPMMLIMPWVISQFDIPPVVGGAWLGGTIDTSGAVVAAGEIVGDSAMNAAVIVKFSQNAMLGLAAFALSVWWTFRTGSATGKKPSASIIWQRFPKFVLGFVVASLLFSFALSAEFVDSTKSLMKGLRTWWFALAFVCIGLETRFRDLVSMDEGRPAIAFLAAQGVNIFWTLIVAWLLFGGVLFEVPAL